MIPTLDRKINQSRQITGTAPSTDPGITGDTYIADELTYYYNDVNYTNLKESEGDLIGVTGTTGSEVFHRTIFEFDSNDFAKLLPSDFFLTSVSYLRIVHEVSSIDITAGGDNSLTYGLYSNKAELNSNLFKEFAEIISPLTQLYGS